MSEQYSTLLNNLSQTASVPQIHNENDSMWIACAARNDAAVMSQLTYHDSSANNEDVPPMQDANKDR